MLVQATVIRLLIILPSFYFRVITSNCPRLCALGVVNIWVHTCAFASNSRSVVNKAGEQQRGTSGGKGGRVEAIGWVVRGMNGKARALTPRSCLPSLVLPIAPEVPQFTHDSQSTIIHQHQSTFNNLPAAPPKDSSPPLPQLLVSRVSYHGSMVPFFLSFTLTEDPADKLHLTECAPLAGLPGITGITRNSCDIHNPTTQSTSDFRPLQ